MPVSKKRKKEGKPVQRQAPRAGEEKGADHPEGEAARPQLKAGKPKNPFAATPTHRGSQRGR